MTIRPSVSAYGHESTPEPGPGTGTAPWIDRLVELHVLAEHGDDASAATAAKWIAEDVHARQVWDHLGQVRDRLESGVPTAAE
jgi:hypothetical protein